MHVKTVAVKLEMIGVQDVRLEDGLAMYVRAARRSQVTNITRMVHYGKDLSA